MDEVTGASDPSVLPEDPGEPVLYEVAAGVATLTLNRPGKLNAWTPAMENVWNGLLDRAGADDDVRALVVTGSGKGFCAGMDMAVLAERAGKGPPPRRERPLTSVADFPKPVIGAINGPCVGLALALALCFDVRFAAPEARFVTGFARRGFVAEFGTSWRLPRLVGQGRAMDLLLTGRPCEADEALAIGLVNWVVPSHELVPAAQAWAGVLAASSSPLSMAAMKEQVAADWLRDSRQSEEVASAMWRDDRYRRDGAEGVASFRERRAPRFAPLGPWPPAGA